jgi:glycosyltransferase involved in cell wall biosynthesis
VTLPRPHLPPLDPVLPGVHRLLEPQAAAPVLERSLHPDAELTDLRLNYAQFKRGRRLIAGYEASIDGKRYGAVAILDSKADLAERARRPEHLARARLAADGSVIEPLRFEPDLDALVQWLPFDIALPALTVPPAQLARLLVDHDLDVPGTDLRVERLDYVPLRRSVVRLGAHVLKSYGKDRKLAEAVLGLRTVQGLRSASTAPLEAVFPDLRVTVQGALGGRLPDNPLIAAGPAGEILRELQALPTAGLPLRPTTRELEAHVVAVRIVRDIAPELEPRATRLLRRLAASRPDDPRPVVAHGDFDDGQMLLRPGAVAVFDFDAVCATHPAMDLARFAAVIVRRDPSRLDSAYAALERLLEAYGEPPPDLDWYLAAQILCQVGSPFRKAWPDWPEKLAAIIAAAEAVLDRSCQLGGASTRPAEAPLSITSAKATRANGSRRDQLVMITSGFPRRSETFAVNEILALERAGALTAVFATKPGDGAEPQPDTEPLLERVQVLPAGTPAQQAEAVLERLEGRPVRAVHGYFAHEPAAVAIEVAERLGVPYGFSVHARDARKVAADRLARQVAGAACVIACNADTIAELPERGENVHLVPHGVDLERFRATPAPRRPGPAVLLAVGRLVPKKGFDVLLEAVSRIEHPFRLRIVGEGPERGSLERLISSFGLQRRVTLCGPRMHAELPREYAAADLVVAPSVVDPTGDRDGLPNVVLEAMACARPVVASDLAAIATAVVPGESGLLVPAGDPGALASAIGALLHEPALRGRLGQKARDRVERDFDLGPCTRRFQRVVEEAYG